MKKVRWTILIALTLFGLRCKGPEGPAGPPGDVTLTDSEIQPQVLYTYPLNNSTGPYTDFNNRVLVRFNKIMDRTSVKRSVQLSSAAGDVQLDTGSVNAQDTDLFNFAPAQNPAFFPDGITGKFQWRLHELYTLTIDTTATDVNGKKLKPRFTMRFKPEPAFRVVTVSPANGAIGIPNSSRIDLTFNSQVDSTIFPKIHISPGLSGRWAYAAAFPAPDSTVIHYAFTGAAGDTVYTITIDADASDKFGNRIIGQFASSFSTATFRITSTSPLNGSTSVSLASSIIVNFSAPVDTGSSRLAFSVVPLTGGTFRYSNNFATVTFVPARRLYSNTRYAVTISSAMKSRNGKQLARSYSFSFLTVPFQVSNSIPGDGVEGISLNNSVSIVCTDFVDTTTVRSAVTVNPALPIVYSLRDSSPTITFLPLNGFLGGTVYTVSVSTTLRSKHGDTLAAPFSSSFTTAPFMVTSVFPLNGASNVPALTATISVRTNGAIDTGSVRSAFAIDPPVPVTFFLSDGAFTFDARPATSLLPATTYTVTLSPLLRSGGGDNLSEPYSFSFTTAPFQVNFTSPIDGSSNVALTANEFVFFSAPIDTTGIDNAFSISPPTSGDLSTYEGGSSIQFTPADGLLQNTSYSIMVSASVHSLNGSSLSQPFTFRFTTASFHLTGSLPIDGSIGVSRTASMSMNFNAFIDTGTVRSAFSVNPPLSGRFTFGTSIIGFNPDGVLPANTTFTVTIGTGLSTRLGDHLPGAVVFSFTTGN